MNTINVQFLDQTLIPLSTIESGEAINEIKILTAKKSLCIL